jgi:glycosyltransferase involved in cell wall biosynthesis
MRVLHIGKFFPPFRGGMEAYLAELIAAQHRAEIEASALVHGTPLPDDPEWLWRVPTLGRVLYAPIAPGFRSALVKAIQHFEPHILHLHLPNTSAFWALTLPEARALPWVIHWHSDVLTHTRFSLLKLAYPFYRPFESALLDQATHIIATSPPYLAYSPTLAPWKGKCTVIPLGLSPQSWTPAPCLPQWPMGCFRLLAIGRLTYYKGFLTLIEAVAQTPGCALIVIGEGEERPKLEAWVKAHVLPADQGRIQLVGGVDEDSKHRLLEACQLFCLPSIERTEAFGMVLLEAFQHGKPCLVSDVAGSGMPWVVRTAKAGDTLPPGDVAAWRAWLERLPEKQPQLAQWSEAAGHALTRFTPESNTQALWPLYRSLCTEPGGIQNESPLIVIPAKDEGQTITKVIEALAYHGFRDVLVIDDHSQDDTAQKAQAAGAIVLKPPLPLGAWGAMQAGIRYGLSGGYVHVITMDADGQHEPACISNLLEAGKAHDVVIGAFTERGSRLRQIAWRFFRALTGFEMRDLTSGFRYYNFTACQVLCDEEATLLDYQDIGVLLILRHAGLSIVEVPVTMYERQSGPSRIFASWGRVARYMLETTLLCLARWHPRHYRR